MARAPLGRLRRGLPAVLITEITRFWVARPILRQLAEPPPQRARRIPAGRKPLTAAELSLDKHMLQDVLRKRGCHPDRTTCRPGKARSPGACSSDAP
jgi:hypothetical protein